MAEIVWTAEAETWLQDIYNYIAQDSAEAAIKGCSRDFRTGAAVVGVPAIGPTVLTMDSCIWRAMVVFPTCRGPIIT